MKRLVILALTAVLLFVTAAAGHAHSPQGYVPPADPPYHEVIVTPEVPWYAYPECGEELDLVRPWDTDQVTYEEFYLYGTHYKVTATLTSPSTTEFAQPLPGSWKLNPAAPWLAEFIVPLTQPC